MIAANDTPETMNAKADAMERASRQQAISLGMAPDCECQDTWEQETLEAIEALRELRFTAEVMREDADADRQEAARRQRA